MIKEVTGYQASWLVNMHKGRLIIRLEGETGQPDLGWFEPAEFQAVIDLLRNEKPLYYDRETGHLMTLMEPPGEGEPQTP